MENLWEKIQPLLWPFFFTILGAYLNKIFDSFLSMRYLKKETLCKRAAYRQEWVNALRIEFATFLAITSNHRGKEDYEKYAENLALNIARIHFYLNPQEEITREIKKCMDDIMHPTPLIERKPPMCARKDLEKFALLAQAILKFEWERIKRELQGKDEEKQHFHLKNAMELYNNWENSSQSK